MPCLRKLAIAAAALIPLGCAGGPQGLALATGANALGCPSTMVSLDKMAGKMFHASGCSSGVDVICTGGMADMACHPGTPHLLHHDHEAFCEDHENQDHGPDAPSQAEFDKLSRQGSLSKEVLLGEVNRYVGLIRACYECARWRDDEAAGLVGARFVVGVDGLVEGVTIEQDDFQDPKLEHCIEGVVYDYRFPPPTGNGPVMAHFPFRLGESPPPSTGKPPVSTQEGLDKTGP